MHGCYAGRIGNLRLLDRPVERRLAVYLGR